MEHSDHLLGEDESLEIEEELSDIGVVNRSRFSSSRIDQLERCGRWLLKIPRDDLIALRQTQEYHDFLSAFERLGHVHRRDIARRNRNLVSLDIASTSTPTSTTPLTTNEGLSVVGTGTNHEHNIHNSGNYHGSSTNHHHHHHHRNSFLQHIAADDIVLRVFEFLECHSLIRLCRTCYRFRELAHKSADQRTYDVANTRQLNNVMKLLRAKEQIDGVGTSIRDRHVCVPILLLSRRVEVSGAGDPEYNGVYFCTGSNGNGFVFTKPRFPEQRVRRTRDNPRQSPQPQPDFGETPGNLARLENEVAQPGQLLRCVIAKRFSNEMILWYLSKEVVATENSDGVRAGEVTQVFAFWAKLMVIGDASPDICRYPSQTSILSRHQESWHTLSTTIATTAPTVELLD